MFQSLYQKYRPQTFNDVIGQGHVVKALSEAVKSKKPSHAYVFAGPRGTGKTSLARIFATSLGIDPTDVLELDAASHTGVDDMREIIDGASVLPFLSPYKIYILDEAHMLSKSAFNALLKTLEEPPRHVIFILATTDPDKLPDTVLSRCSLFRFAKPGYEHITEALMRAAKGEKIKLDADAAALLAILADGSFRDGLSALGQVIASHPGQSIDRELVASVTGAPRDEYIEAVLLGIDHTDHQRILKAIRELEKVSAQAGMVVQLMIDRVRLVLLARFAGAEGAASLAEQSEQVRAFVAGVVGNKQSKINAALLAELLKLAGEIRRSPMPYALIEARILALLG